MTAKIHCAKRGAVIATIDRHTPAPSRGVPFTRFLVSRVILAGRGRVNSPDEESSEEPIFENRPMSLWETVEELRSCSEVSCSQHATALLGSEYATTSMRYGSRGWSSVELVMVRRGNGQPISGCMLLWLFRAAGLVWDRRTGR